MKQYDGNNIDDLLIDVKNLLEEDRKPVVQRERTLRQKMETEREAERIAEIMRGAAEHAERETRAYGHQRETRPFEPVRDVEEAETPRQRVVAYNTDFSDNRFRENFQPRRQEEPPVRRRQQPQEPMPKKKRRGSGKMITIGVHHSEKGAYYANPVEFGHGGPAPAPAHPFVRPAYDTRADEAYAIIREGLQDAIDNL